jgi:hypothetical protein
MPPKKGTSRSSGGSVGSAAASSPSSSSSSSSSSLTNSINDRSLRFARPNLQPVKAHANHLGNTVSSTPGFSGIYPSNTSSSSFSSSSNSSGSVLNKRRRDEDGDDVEDDTTTSQRRSWPGPFSVARSILKDRESQKNVSTVDSKTSSEGRNTRIRESKGAKGVSVYDEYEEQDCDYDMINNENYYLSFQSLSKQYESEFSKMLPQINASIQDFAFSSSFVGLNNESADSPGISFSKLSRESHNTNTSIASTATYTNQSQLMPLKDMCIKSISEYLETYAGAPLDFIPADCTASILHQLNKSNQVIISNVLKLLSSNSDSIDIINCTNLDEFQLISIFRMHVDHNDKKTVSGGEVDDGKRYSKIRSIKLGNCGNCFTDAVVDFLLTSLGEESSRNNFLSELQSLHLVGLYRISDAKLQKFLSFLRSSLCSLDLSYKSSLSLTVVRAIHDELFQLRYLNLSGILDVADAHIICLCNGGEGSLSLSNSSGFINNTQLRHILLNGLTSISDSSMQILLQKIGPKLNTLSVEKCSQLTDSTALAIRKYCSNLKSLNISDLFQVSTEALLSLFITNRDRSSSSSCALGLSSDDTSNISKAPMITNNSLITETTSVPNRIGELEAISLNNLPNLSDEVLIELLRNYGGAHAFASRPPNRSSGLATESSNSTSYSVANAMILDGAAGDLPIGGGYTPLRSLELAGASITDTSFAALIWCYYNSSVGFGPESTSNSDIHQHRDLVIDVSFCRQISGSLLCFLVASCSRLKKLLVFGNSQLNKVLKVNRKGTENGGGASFTFSENMNIADGASVNNCPIDFLATFFRVELVGLSNISKII